MENYFCMSLRVMSNFVKKYINEKITTMGLTSFQCGVLHYVYENTKNGAVVFQKNLEDFFVTSKSSMSDLLQSLESKGLIMRVSSENGDSRKKEITLTDEGKRMNDLTDKILDEVEQFFLSSLDEGEKEDLFKIFDKFSERMERKVWVLM